MTRAVARWLGPLLPAGAGLLAGCNRVQSVLDPVGDQAAAIKHVWDLMLWVCVPMYLLVMVALGWAFWRNRRDTAAATSERRVFIGVTAMTVLTIGLLTVLTAASYVTERRLHAPVSNPVNVRITAEQWWWRVDYPNDADPSKQFTTANELHLPVDRPARIELRSGDVIHSLWIPVLNGKEDLIPGHNNTIVMTPRHVGAYRGQCAEFCGLQHAKMALDVQVDDAAGFAAWQARQLATPAAPSTSSAAIGQQLFTRLPCANCHAIQGTDAGGVVGPDLTHVASRRTLAAGALPMDRNSMQGWIADPQFHKPGSNMPAVPLTQQQLSQITDYLMGLK